MKNSKMKKLTLDICKQSDGHDYGHSNESVKKYEALVEQVEDFFEGKELRFPDNKILGIKVSNSGCNIWLVIHHHGRENAHTIHTTQNRGLGAFGHSPRRTDLQRFVN